MSQQRPPQIHIVARLDLEERKKIYDEAQSLLTESEVPMIPLFINAQNLLVKSYVRGLKTNAMELLYLKKIRLERQS